MSFLTFDICRKTLSEAVDRALGSIISKFQQFKNVEYHTFTKLYDTGVNSTLYPASPWYWTWQRLWTDDFSNLIFGVAP